MSQYQSLPVLKIGIYSNLLDQGLFSQNFLYFITYEWPNKLEC
jgi:hypothetical protein